MRFKIYMILTGIIFLFTNCNDVLDRVLATWKMMLTGPVRTGRVCMPMPFIPTSLLGIWIEYEATYAPSKLYL